MEALLEGQDREVGSTRRLVGQRRSHLGLGKVDIRAAALLLPSVHESGLVCKFIGIRTSLGCEDLVQASWCHRKDARLEDISPVMLREVAQCRAVDDGRDHLRRGSCELEGRVVVADRDGGNLRVDIEEDVAVKIGNAATY